MFIFTAKIKHGKVVLGALGLAAVCTAGLLLFGLPGKQTAAANSTLPSPKGVKTAEDRIAYLESYGWLIDPEPIAVEELLIPEEFDETYQDYLDLQKHVVHHQVNAPIKEGTDYLILRIRISM